MTYGIFDYGNRLLFVQYRVTIFYEMAMATVGRNKWLTDRFPMLRQVLLGVLIVESSPYSFASGCLAGAPIATLTLTVLPAKGGPLRFHSAP